MELVLSCWKCNDLTLCQIFSKFQILESSGILIPRKNSSLPCTIKTFIYWKFLWRRNSGFWPVLCQMQVFFLFPVNELSEKQLVLHESCSLEKIIVTILPFLSHMVAFVHLPPPYCLSQCWSPHLCQTKPYYEHCCASTNNHSTALEIKISFMTLKKKKKMSETEIQTHKDWDILPLWFQARYPGPCESCDCHKVHLRVPDHLGMSCSSSCFLPVAAAHAEEPWLVTERVKSQGGTALPTTCHAFGLIKR